MNIPGIGGLSYQTIPNSNYTTGTILNVDNAHDGDWSTYAVPNNEGSFYYNYTIPVGAKTTSMFRISDSGWGWDIQLPLDCYGPAGTDLAFRSDANRTGVGAGYVLTYCQNYSDGNWILARNNSEAGPYFFETMMTWVYDTQVNIEVIPQYFDDELQDNTAGIDGEYNTQFWMYYGDPDALNNESVLNYDGIDNSPLIYGPEVGPVLNDPIIYYLNDTEGRTATGTNISWSVDQIVDNRLKIATNPYILDSYFYSYITNTTQQEHSLLGSESHVILTSTSPSEWMNMINVTCSNSSYDNNYTVNSTVNPVTITIPDLNAPTEFLDWNFTYQENKTWEIQSASVVWPVRNLTTNTQYWYEAIAYGTNGNGTANGTFILGTLPSTPTISILNYSEYRPTKTVTICADLTDMNGNPTIDVSFQYWNQTDLSFKETSPPTTVGSIGPVCANISVEFGELNSYRAKAVGATTGYSASYANEVMPIQEFFAGNTVEDNNDAPMFRQYCPPNPDGTVNLLAKCYEQKGYREGSLQEWTSMYVETNASTDTLTLHLYLLNGTSISSTVMDTSLYGFKYLTINNLGQDWYTFYITNTSLTDNVVLNWTKPGLTHKATQSRTDISKYVSFNGTTSPFNYTLLYFNNPGVYNTSVYQWCQAAPGGNLFDCMSAQYWGTSGMSAALAGTAYDRGQFFRGGVTNGELYDSGLLDYTKNSSAPLGDFRQCFAFTVYYFDESLIPNNNITNYRYVYWQENEHFSDFNGRIEPVVFHESYLFNFEYDTLTATRDWKTYSGTDTDNRTVVKTVGNTVFNSSYNQSLVIGEVNNFNVELKNDKQYDFGIYFDGNWINQRIGKYQQSYIIFNLPDNATLSILDSDNDGINDFDEVYVYYINPKSNDTDEDGMTDGNEITGGYDPLLYNSHAASNVTLIAPANNSYHNTDQNFTADITTVSGISSIRLYINNVLTETYNTVGSVVSMTIGFVEVLSDGVYSWFYGATDNTGMSSNSTIFNVTIDKALPGIIITYPLNINYAINVSAINYTITDINSDSCWYSKDNGITNSTAQSPGTNWTGVISAEGSNTWTVYCNDSAGNINSSSVTFAKWTGTNIIDCQTLSTAGATYTQRANIINNTIVNDCIRITAVNITLNCNGYYISSIKNYTGVYSNAKNTTIKNCNITMGPIGGTGINVNTIGIELPMDSDFGILYNNTARADIGAGIRIDASNTNLTSNTGISNISNGIFTTGNEYGYISTNNIFNSNKGISDSGAAIYLFRTSNNNLTNNTGTSNSNVGIKIDNSPNTIIISNNGTSSLSQGINLYGSANSILTSNIGTSNISSGIYISTSPNATLTSNNGTSNIGQGIFLTGCSKSILTDNTGTSNADIGINVFNSNNNILIGNNGTSNIGTNNYGIYIDGTNNTLTNNIGITNTSIGIVLYTISNSTITNNIGTSTSNVGIYLYTSLNNKLTSNTGTSSDGTNAMGIYLSSSSNNNLTNNTGISNSNAGIYLLSSLNNTLTNNIGKSNTSYATYLGFSNNNILLNHNSEGYLTDSIGIVFRNGNNNIIQDCINISGISGDVLYKEAASINNTFINCTYRNTGTNESVMAGSSLIRKWYYRAYVNDTDGNSLNGANITALNVSGTTEFTGLLTNTSGLINITTITEYVNVAGIIHYYSNYTLSASLSGFPIKSHTYNVTQQLNNLNDYFTLDITIPKINIVYPISNNYTSLVTQLNYTVSDLELQSCWYSLDNGVTNTSTPCGDNVTGILSNQGYNNWTVWANDTSGNTNSSTVKFYSDSILPNATLISPLNDTYTNITTQNFTANLTDNLAIWNATLNIYNQTDNTIVNQTTQTFIEGVIQYTIGIPVYLVDGIYNWFYDIFDLAGNHAVSENRTLVIDTIYPTIEFGVGTQPNNTFINATNIYVDIIVTDTNEANVTFYLYNISGPVNQTTLGAGNRTFNWTNLVNDKYFYRVIVMDKVGNQNSTELRTINLDTTPPVIDLISPPTNYLTNITLNDFVANITDYIELSNLTFNIYYWNGTIRFSNFTDIYSLNVPNYLMTNSFNLSHNAYYWQYQAYDKIGFETTSDNRTIFVDTLPPTLTLLSPPNLAHVNSPVSFIVSITNDFSNISSATLYIYNSTGSEVNQTTTDLTALETNQTIVITTVNLSQYGNLLENFTWRYSANDTYGHTDNSSTYQVTLDTILPQILWTHPLAGENPWQNTTPFTIIAVASDAYLDAVNVSVFNATEEMYYNNFTENITTSPFIIGDTVTLQEGANRIEICARDSLTGSPEIKSISEFSKTTEKVSVFSTSAKVPEKSKTISSEMITRTIDLFQKDGKEIDAKLQNLKTTDEWIGNNHYKTTWIMDRLPEGFYIEIKLTSNKNLRLLTDRGVTRIVSNNYYFRYDDISDNGFDIKYNQISSKEVLMTITQGKAEIKDVMILDPITGGLNNKCENQTVYLDTHVPNVTLNTPLNGTYSNITSQNLTTNLTDNLGIKNTTLFIYNQTGLYNETSVTFPLNVLESTVGVVVSFTDGIYHWWYQAWDWAGNTFISPTNNTITIDTTYPGIIITYPENITYIYVPTAINYTYSELTPLNCWYSIDGGITNVSLTCGDNVTGLLANQGNNVWMIRMEDTLSNIAQTYVTFFVDSIYPEINFTAPTELNGSYLSRTNIKINVTASDTNLMNVSIKVYNSISIQVGGANWNDVVSNSFWYNFTDIDGVYYYNATVVDILGNYNQTETRMATLDTTNPLIEYGTGTAVNHANLSQSNIYVNVSWTDINFANITFTLKNLTDFVNITTYTVPGDDINWTNLPDTDYTYYVNITDLADNKNSTNIRSIRLDTHAPNATLLTPVNDTYTTVTSQNLTVNLTDNLGIKNATLFIWNQTASINQTNTNFAIDTLQTTLGIVVTLVDDAYHWWYQVWDWAGNSVTTINNTLVIDTIYPVITYANPTTPAGGPYNLTAIWSNMSAVDTNLLTISSTIELVNGVIPPYSNTQTLSPTVFPQDSLYYNWTSLSQGIYKLSGFATDKLGHRTYIVNRTINIDVDSPVISYELPTQADGTTTPFNYFTINVSATDPNLANIIIYYWYLNQTVHTQTVTSYANTSINTLVQSGLPDGMYYYNASAIDTQTRISWLPTRSINVQHANQTLGLCKELFVAGGTYTVVSDLTSATTCLNVTAPDITVNCQWHTITGNDAILATKPGLTLRDCIVTSPLKAGLRVKGNSPASVNIYNATFMDSPYGILVASEGNIYADTITVTDNGYGIYFNNSNNGNTIKNILMYGNIYDSMTFINSSYNSINTLLMYNATDSGNDGTIVFSTSTDNKFDGCNILALNPKIWGLTDYSINNLLYSCYYSSDTQDSVDGTSQLIRSWPFTGSVVDKVFNKMQGASILFRASIPTNRVVTYKYSGINITYGTLGGITYTDSLGLAYTNITEYMNIFGEQRVSTPYYFNASYNIFTPTVALLNMNDSDISRYHQFVLGDEIASSSISRTAMWLILGIVFLIGLAASIGFFIVRMREGYSVVDIWKYFIILVIWLTIFSIIYYVLAWFIMGAYYPQV
jgi:parallel beta-helix repeat protein